MPSASPSPATASLASVNGIVPFDKRGALVEVGCRRHRFHEHRDDGRNRPGDGPNRLDGTSITATGARIEPVGVAITATDIRSGPGGPRIAPANVPIWVGTVAIEAEDPHSPPEDVRIRSPSVRSWLARVGMRVADLRPQRSSSSRRTAVSVFSSRYFTMIGA
jgi:hypothetical protein